MSSITVVATTYIFINRSGEVPVGTMTAAMFDLHTSHGIKQMAIVNFHGPHVTNSIFCITSPMSNFTEQVK